MVSWHWVSHFRIYDPGKGGAAAPMYPPGYAPGCTPTVFSGYEPGKKRMFGLAAVFHWPTTGGILEAIIVRIMEAMAVFITTTKSLRNENNGLRTSGPKTEDVNRMMNEIP
jgi:hypothetical protein